ncbi:MAG: LacI family transcriptional regulator [Succinivibrio sp.]|nr:LacI family transcriptional regulator [Succinivibrio sp.]
MVNISQIASHLGISPSTVSRALKKPNMVSLETRHQVLAAAEQLGYLKKLRDDVTSASSSNLIGVIAADLTNSFSNAIVKAVTDYLDSQHYSVIIGCNYEHSSLESKILKQWATLNLRGLIIMPTGKFGKTITSTSYEKPVVLVDRQLDELKFDCVIEDNQAGVGLILNYLQELGHEKIAFISGSKKVYTFAQRCQGVEQSGVKAEVHEVLADSYEELFIGAFEQTNILMLRAPALRPTAIVGANNAITSGILYALNLKGFKIPQDISVVSYGDSGWCRFYPTPITSVCQPVEEMGRMAATLLLDRINGSHEQKQNVCLKSMLLRRASTSSPKES